MYDSVKSGDSQFTSGEALQIQLLRQGDETAYEELYRFYWKRLFFLAAKKLNDLAEAEDVVQEIFLDLWNRRQLLQLTTSLNAYLATAVKYKVIDRLARVHRHRAYQSYNMKTNVTAEETTQEQLSLNELQESLYNSMATLPEKCRMVFEMSRIQGFSQRQIAQHLGIAEKTVESHLSRALRTLRIDLSRFFMFFFF